MKEYIQQYTSIQLTDAQQEQLNTLSALLVENNAKFNLTAITDSKEIEIKHFVDCAVGVNYIKQGASVLDVGAGGGFPSFVLAILRPDIKLTMLDSNARKIEYCRNVAQQLGIEADTICGRVEDCKNLKGKFDYAVARAVAETDILIEYMAFTVKVGGRIILYKGIQQQTFDNVATMLGLSNAKVHLYELPLEYGQRRLLIYKKIKPTPPIYPRANAAIRKQPLSKTIDNSYNKGTTKSLGNSTNKAQNKIVGKPQSKSIDKSYNKDTTKSPTKGVNKHLSNNESKHYSNNTNKPQSKSIDKPHNNGTTKAFSKRTNKPYSNSTNKLHGNGTSRPNATHSKYKKQG